MQELEESPRCLVLGTTLYIRELGLGALKEKVAANSVRFYSTFEHNIFQPSLVSAYQKMRACAESLLGMSEIKFSSFNCFSVL